jgi:hypothetical protein
MPAPGSRDGADQDPSELDFQYAWNWFSYHASQRLTAFNFFLVLLGAILVGYSQAASHDVKVLGAALGLFGALVSAAFWVMDVRNTELVQCGRAALDQLEDSPVLHVRIRHSDGSRVYLKDVIYGPVTGRMFAAADNGFPQFTSRVFTHSFWLRSVMMSVGLASLVATGWALFGFPGR